MPRFGALSGRDAYDILGVAPTATDREIEQARRRLQLKHHPDRHGDPAESAMVNVAAEILLDVDVRAEYDAFRAGSPPEAATAAGSGGTAWDGAAAGFRPEASPFSPPGRSYPAYPPPAAPGPMYPPMPSVIPPMPSVIPPMPPPPMAGPSRRGLSAGWIVAISLGGLLLLICLCGLVESLTAFQPSTY